MEKALGGTVAVGAGPLRSESMILKASLMTDPRSLCNGAGTLLAQVGSTEAVMRLSRKEIGWDAKALCTLVGMLVMRTEMTDEASGSSTRDATYWSTSAAASRGSAARLSIDSMTGLGMAETQAGVVDAAARESRRTSGSFSASWMMEAGRSSRRTATSLWKAGLDSSAVMKSLASVIIFDA